MIYFVLSSRNALVLQFDPDEAAEIAAVDWARDMGAGMPASKDQFQKSLREVADMWTVSAEADEYEEFMQRLFLRVTQSDAHKEEPTFEPIIVEFKPLQEVEGGSISTSRLIPSPMAIKVRAKHKKRTRSRPRQKIHLGANVNNYGSAFTGNGTARSFRWRKANEARQRRVPAGVMLAKPSPAPSVTLMVTYDKLRNVRGGRPGSSRGAGSLPGSPDRSTLARQEVRGGSSRSGTVSNRPTSALTVVQQQQQRLWHSIQSQQNQQLLLMQHIQQQQRANNARAATMAAQSLVSSLPLKPPSPPSFGRSAAGATSEGDPTGALNGRIVSQRVVLPAITAEQR
jgi:hypothetical protein